MVSKCRRQRNRAAVPSVVPFVGFDSNRILSFHPIRLYVWILYFVKTHCLGRDCRGFLSLSCAGRRFQAFWYPVPAVVARIESGYHPRVHDGGERVVLSWTSCPTNDLVFFLSASPWRVLDCTISLLFFSFLPFLFLGGCGVNTMLLFFLIARVLLGFWRRVLLLL